MSPPIGETRAERERLIKRALADITRQHIGKRRLRQIDVVRLGGFSRSHIRAMLRAEKCCSLFIFVELCRGLGIDDPCELLREVLDRHNALLHEQTGGAS